MQHKVKGWITALAAAAMVAALSASIAHDGFGISRDTIHNVALISAAVFCAAVAGAWLKHHLKN